MLLFHNTKTNRRMKEANVVSRAGVEPAAFPLGGGRSIQLSYRDIFLRGREE